MPTLRNKTTDDGVIIRWKPHPRHKRPSTYQVSPRAVSFLQSLGYKVPHPGDEAAIPPQVCRPLRLLGDLYFESGSQNDVELGNPPARGYYKTSGLSQKQLGQLRFYVESHPSYIGGLRNDLGKELAELPESRSEEDIPRPRLEPETRNIRYASDGRILLPEPFYIGKIDRLSNNNNAIISTTARKEVNLGRLPKSTVDEWTIGVEYRGNWTMCLTPQLWSTGYRSDAQNFIEELERLTGLDGLDKILGIHQRHYNKDLNDAELEVNVCYAGHGLGVAYHGEWTIVIDSELVAAGQKINVRVEEVYGNIGIAVPSRPKDPHKLSVGDRINIDITKIGRNLLVGSYKGEFVIVPRETSVIPNEISAAITEACEGYVKATVRALPESERPAMQSTVDICEGKIKDYPNIPVKLPDIPFDQSKPIRLPVETVNTDSVTVSARAFKDTGLFTGDTTVTSSIQYWSSEGLIIQMSDIPMLVRGVRYAPGTTVQVRPTKLSDGYIEAEFKQFVLPELPQTFNEGIKKGDSQLRTEAFEDAVTTFVAVVESTDVGTEPKRWVDALIHEIISLTASAVAKKEFDDALELLKIRTETLKQDERLSESLRISTQNELYAYWQLIEARRWLKQVDQTDDGAEQTAARQEVKHLLTDVVELLEELPPLSGRKRPHWFIHDQLQTAADEMLILPPSVKDYLKK